MKNMMNIFVASLVLASASANPAAVANPEKYSTFVKTAMAINDVVEGAAVYGNGFGPPQLAVTNKGDVLFIETLPQRDGATYSHILWFAER
ncbi:MAG: hypothetical protein RLN85_06935, partial [Pseudomonadales bacterium]